MAKLHVLMKSLDVALSITESVVFRAENNGNEGLKSLSVTSKDEANSV